MVGALPAAERLLDEHETWAGRTQTAAVIGAVVALAAAVAGSRPRVARPLGFATAAIAIVAAWCVYETGHRGGKLVYQHGAGVFVASGPIVPAGAADAAKIGGTTRRDDD